MGRSPVAAPQRLDLQHEGGRRQAGTHWPVPLGPVDLDPLPYSHDTSTAVVGRVLAGLVFDGNVAPSRNLVDRVVQLILAQDHKLSCSAHTTALAELLRRYVARAAHLARYGNPELAQLAERLVQQVTASPEDLGWGVVVRLAGAARDLTHAIGAQGATEHHAQ